MTIKQAAQALGMSEQCIRVQMRRGLLPIGICKKAEKNWCYWVFDKWVERFLQGDPVNVSEITQKEEVYEK